MKGWKQEGARGSPSGDLKDSALEQELAGLMRLSQAGDAAAYRLLLQKLERLATRYVKRALGFGYGLDAARCEDVVQEILLGVHAKRHTHDPVRLFLPWFYGIARYKAIDEARRLLADRQVAGITDDLEIAAQNADASAAMDVDGLLATLPEKQRSLVKMVKLEGLSVGEAAGRTGYSPSDVRVSIHRALKALRKRAETMFDEHA